MRNQFDPAILYQEDFSIPNFSSPTSSQTIGSIIGPHQQVSISAIVDRFYDDTEVDKIKYGKGKATYIWGTVTYEDIFGERHETNFCHWIHWIGPGPKGEEIISGYYVNRRNDAS